jgi:predicted DNA-binding transcriptional regulator YafY
VDVGQMQAAQVLMELLLEKGNMENVFREDLTSKLQTQAGAEAWRRVIDSYIEQRQPFFLVYENEQGEKEQFHVNYGEITFHEKRLYLDAWCEEEQENPAFAIEELKHNHSFPLERIISALNYPSKWRYQGLNHIQVHLHFYGAMIKDYQIKAEDLEVHQEKEQLKVVKRISNPFWLIREIYPYRDQCEIISPLEVREKYLEEWEEIGKRYGKIVLNQKTE